MSNGLTKVGPSVSRLMANIKEDRVQGLSDDEILAKRAADVEQVMRALPWAMLIRLLPVAVKIIKELKGGKSIIEVIVEYADQIVEFIEQLVPDEDEAGPQVVS